MYVGKPIEATNVYAGCVAEFENIWPDYKSIIKKIDNETKNATTESPLYFAPALTIGQQATGGPQKERTNSHLGISVAAEQNDFFRELNNRFFFTVLDAVNWYKQRFSIHEELHHTEGYNLLKYQTGEEYKAHYDGGTATGRMVSPILYLNDNYTGGELEFVNYNLKIKPKPGSLYLFPSAYSHTHIAHPVETGTKYAIVTWLHDILG